MRKMMILLAGISLVLAASSVTWAGSNALERAHQLCLEECVEMDEAVCAACCESAFQPIVMECRSMFVQCLDGCRDDDCRNRCIFKIADCGSDSRGVHACP
ncbi:hypothetical protein [Desulfonatronum parangueonense]